MSQLDTKLVWNTDKKYYDIVISEDGTLLNDDSLDNAILTCLFWDGRADSSQVSQPQNRKGWHLNELRETNDEVGSLLWLLRQRRRTQTTLNDAVDYAQNALQRLVSNGIINNVAVTAEFTSEALQLNIRLTKTNNVVETRTFNLFKNSIPLEEQIFGSAES